MTEKKNGVRAWVALLLDNAVKILVVVIVMWALLSGKGIEWFKDIIVPLIKEVK